MGDSHRPLYTDYKKRAWSSIIHEKRIHSNERLFGLADRPLILSVYLELIAAFLFIFCYLPKPEVYSILLFISMFTAAFVSSRLYLRRFVYRYGRFYVTWEDWQAHPVPASECCDESGAFLNTRENRAAGFKSRFAFAVLFLIIAAAAVTFYLATWGMAERRLVDSPQLREFARIAQKQGEVSLSVDTDGVEVWSADGETALEIGKEDEDALLSVYNELQWNYVDEIEWENGQAHVNLRAGLEKKSFDILPEQQ